MKRPAWAEIDLEALLHNVREIRRITNERAEVLAVVKANAYGHGVVPVCRTALKGGAGWFGVALLQEAIQLREEGITAPIVVLGYTPDRDAADLIENDISQTIFTWDNAVALAQEAVRLGKKAKIHLKIDTGMGRIGFQPGEETVELIKRMVHLPGLEVEGIYTHFATADEKDKSFTEEQFMKFQCLLKRLAAEQISIRWKHCANSAALLDFPYTHLDLVRPGIILYGLYPSPDVNHDLINLRPVMSLKAQVAYVKELPAGRSISYGRRFYTKRKSTIATIPLGYADGYPRYFTNRCEVLIHGRRAPLVGTVCMDQMMADVTDIPGVVQGDEVVIMGRQGEQEITADELAEKLGTINYEILCMVSERVPRVYLGGE